MAHSRRLRTLALLLGVAVLCASQLFAEGMASTGKSAPAGNALMLTGARLLTQTDAGDFVGDVLIQGGKIAAVGPNLKAPADCQKLDLTGFTLCPGFIDVRSSLWLANDAGRDVGRDGSLNILDALDSYDEDWHEVARQGVTTVCVQPRGPIAGFGALLKVAPAANAEELVVKKDAGYAAALYTGATSTAGPAALPDLPPGLPPQILELLRQRQQQPAAPQGSNSITRYAQVEALKRHLEAIKKYQEDKPSKKDPLKERQLGLVNKTTALRVEAHLDDDLKNALKLAEELKLKLVLEGVSQPKAVAAELKSRRTPMILGPILDLETASTLQKGRAVNWPLNCLGDENRFALGTYSNSGRGSQWLRFHAAALVAAGVSEARAMRALTADAADLLGAGNELGRLAVGQRATLAVFAGHPLDTSTAARLVLVDGKTVYESRYLKPATMASSPRTLPGFVSAWQPLEGGDENADANTAELRPCDRLDPQSKTMKDLRAGGFPTVVAATPTSNVIAGQVTACDLAGGTNPQALGCLFTLTATSRNRERWPASLSGQQELLTAALAGEPLPTRLYLPDPLKTRLLADRAANVKRLVGDKQVAYFFARTPAEVAAALELTERFGLNTVLVQPREVLPVLEDLKRLKVAILVSPIESGDTAKEWADLATASQAGVPLLFGNASPQRLRATAAILAQHGADPETLLGALGNQGRERLGIKQAAGTTRWTGSPLDLRQKVEQ